MPVSLEAPRIHNEPRLKRRGSIFLSGLIIEVEIGNITDPVRDDDRYVLNAIKTLNKGFDKALTHPTLYSLPHHRSPFALRPYALLISPVDKKAPRRYKKELRDVAQPGSALASGSLLE